MDFSKPINWGMKRFFPENMTVEDDANTLRITEKIAVQLAERVDDACASAVLNEMGAEGYAVGVVLNKVAVMEAIKKQRARAILRGGLCPGCMMPVHRPAGIGNTHYCVHCGQLVTWRRE